MKAIFNRLDNLGFDSYIDALVAFYSSSIDSWDLSELTINEKMTLELNHRVING